MPAAVLPRKQPSAKSKAGAVSEVQETSARIVAATRELMIENGILEVSLADITARAGVNVALVSYHFGGREGLMLAVAKADAQRAISDLTRLIASDHSPTLKMWLHVAGLIGAHFQRPYLNRLLQKMLREGSPEAAKEIGNTFIRPVFEARKAIIEEGITSGEFRDVDPALVGFAIDGACAQIFSSAASRYAILGDGTLSADLSLRYQKSTADIIINGLLSSSAVEQSGR